MVGIEEIDGDLTRVVLRMLSQALPPRTKLLLLGSTAALTMGVPTLTRTKDVDVALVLIGEERGIAPLSDVMDLARRLRGRITRSPEDGSWVRFSLLVGDRQVGVEAIRGKSRDRRGGTFITRDLLRAIAQRAEPLDGSLLPSVTDLIVMKAWAVTDQSRHLEEAPQSEQYRRRRNAFQDDSRRLTEWALGRNVLATERVEELLAMMKEHRRKEVRAALIEAGVFEPDNDGG